MGLDVSTKAVPPTFPLFFHERLRFERVLIFVYYLSDVYILHQKNCFYCLVTSYCKQQMVTFNFNPYFPFKTFKNCQDPAYVSVLLKGKPDDMLY